MNPSFGLRKLASVKGFYFMKSHKLSQPEKMLLALLRASINAEEPKREIFEGVAPCDWKSCSDIAVQQGVLALAWDGVKRLPIELQPYRNLKISWALAVEQYEQTYERYCNVVEELSQHFKDNGLSMIQLKGVGLSTIYPVPNHREGGDIDIYVCREGGFNAPSDKEISNKADDVLEKIGCNVKRNYCAKHSFCRYKGIPVENHKSFLDLGEYEIATQVEELLKNCINPVKATLPNGGVVLTPSSEFNTLFVAYHNAMHYGSGFSLHHLVDWACVIRKYGLNLPKALKDKHFLRGIAAMTQLSNKYLGTNVPIKGGEKLAAEMLEEIFHPINDRIMPEGNVFKHYLCRAKRFYDMTHIKNSILYIPLWRNVAFKHRLRKTIKRNIKL